MTAPDLCHEVAEHYISIMSRQFALYLGGCLGGCHPERPSGREGSLQLISNTWALRFAQVDSAELVPQSCGT